MNITKKRLKAIIKEEYHKMIESPIEPDGTLTENERLVFKDILGRLTPTQLREFGITKNS